jgi:hypothetical protein
VRRHLRIGIPTVLAAMLAMLPVAAFASSAVLTSGGRGSDGLAVQSGAQLEARVAGGVTFGSSTGGGVLANPTAPGTANLSITSVSFSGCASTIEGTTGVESVRMVDSSSGTPTCIRGSS